MTTSGPFEADTASAAGVAAGIRGIATHLPARLLTNAELSQLFPEWPPEKILAKLGISERHIAAPDETAADLAYHAACNLLASGCCGADEIDFLILCTQSPDYILPTSACILQSRLGLRQDIGALDINLGCSGFVYGVSLAAGLIASGAATNVLLLTADTYSKFMNDGDRSVRTLFGDGAAATLISASPRETSRIGPFVFGTDGRGASSLIVETGGARVARCADSAIEATDGAGNVRSRDNLKMSGAAVLSFTLREVPKTFEKLLKLSNLQKSDYDYFVVHQGNKFLLDALQNKLAVPDAQFPRFYEAIGNTVSSTIPFVLAELMKARKLEPSDKVMLLGFGVGLSWAGANIVW